MILMYVLADIVTEIEDSQLCPGDDILDPSLYTYSTPTKEPEKVVETPKAEEVLPNVQISETAEVTKKVQEEEKASIETDTEKVAEPESETSKDDLAEVPVEEEPEVVPSPEPDIEQEPDTIAPTTKQPTTTSMATTTPHRLIVGTPLDASTLLPVNEYTIDEQYDDYEDTQPLFDTPEAQQEALVQIKRSESFWAFMSCTVLVVGKSNRFRPLYKCFSADFGPV